MINFFFLRNNFLLLLLNIFSRFIAYLKDVILINYFGINNFSDIFFIVFNFLNLFKNSIFDTLFNFFFLSNYLLIKKKNKKESVLFFSFFIYFSLFFNFFFFFNYLF